MRSIYDPNAKWRRDPATPAQMRRLAEEGVATRPGLTKGEASDLISSTEEIDDDQLEMLKFFGVRLKRGATQLDANRALGALGADPANVERWENRPASKEQHDLIKAVEGKAPSATLTHKEAEARIDAYRDDEAKSAKLDAAEDGLLWIEGRREAIKEHCESLNEREGGWSPYGLKRVSLALVTRAVEKWERQTGKPLEQLERDDCFLERLAEHIREIDSSKATTDFANNPAYFRPSTPTPVSSPPSSQHRNRGLGIALLVVLFVGVAIGSYRAVQALLD